MLTIKIDSTETVTKSGNAKASGKPYSITEQTGLVQFPNGECRRLALSLEANETPLAVGTYEPKPSAFYADRFGIAVSMRARHWQRVEAARKAA